MMARSKEKSKYEKYTTMCYLGRSLLRYHTKEDRGIWQILGEDSNAELTGSHYQPDLGIVKGKLDDVIRYAVDLPGFWAWGGGGDIKRLEANAVPTVVLDDVSELNKLADDIRGQMDENPETLLPTAAEVKARIAKENKPLPLTYGMISKIKKALDTATEFPIVVEFDKTEFSRREKTIVDVLAAQGFSVSTESKRMSPAINVIVDLL